MKLAGREPEELDLRTGLTGPVPFTTPRLTVCTQGVEYGSDEEEEDEEEEASPPYPSAIEVFDLAENEDLSPLETDPEKLAHKYKEVRSTAVYCSRPMLQVSGSYPTILPDSHWSCNSHFIH